MHLVAGAERKFHVDVTIDADVNDGQCGYAQVASRSITRTSSFEQNCPLDESVGDLSTAEFSTPYTDQADDFKEMDSLRSTPCPTSYADVVVAAKLESLVTGVAVADRYRIEGASPHQMSGCYHATDKTTSKRVILKFFPEPFPQWRNAIRIHQQLQQNKHVCELLEVLEEERGLPPCLVFDGGECTLADALARGRLAATQGKDILSAILKALESIHQQGIVHGTLDPSNIAWFSSDFCWKLTNSEHACFSDGETPLHVCRSRYTAPEILQALDAGETSLCRNPAEDMWSLGVIAFELLAYAPPASSSGPLSFFPCPDSCAYDASRLRDVIRSRLEEIASERRVPQTQFDADGSGRFGSYDEERSLRFVENLLCPDPNDRQTASQALNEEIFRSAADDHAEIERFESPFSNRGSWAASFLQLPKWAWLCILNDHITVDLRVECFLKSSNASDPFHTKKTQEALRFFDDFLPVHPVHILRLEKDMLLRFCIKTLRDSPFTIEKVLSFRVRTTDEDFVELEMAQRDQEAALEAMALLQPSKFTSKKLHVISPYFGSVERKYLKLTAHVRVLLGAPFCREVDLHHPVYCKIVHPRARLCFHRLLGMFENQQEHDMDA